MSTYAYETASVAVFIWAIIIAASIIHLGDPPSSNNFRPPINSAVVQSVPSDNEHNSSTRRIAWTTAYSPLETCTKGRKACITASGRSPVEGRTYACPRDIPLETRIGVDGKKYVCEDRTAKRFDGRFDRFVEDGHEAMKLGITQKEITIFNN